MPRPILSALAPLIPLAALIHLPMAEASTPDTSLSVSANVPDYCLIHHPQEDSPSVDVKCSETVMHRTSTPAQVFPPIQASLLHFIEGAQADMRIVETDAEHALKWIMVELH